MRLRDFMMICFVTGFGSTFALAASEPIEREWQIDGMTRKALIYLPEGAKSQEAPVVFGFHGHGGTARNVSRAFNYQTHWPEAIIVYMQGIPTPGSLTDPEGKRTGWQKAVGDQKDRDLKFFDVVLKDLKSSYKVAPKQIYATGHSNGGGFTYVLWAARHDVFAAVAPSAASSGWSRAMLKPLPALHVAGENDPLVKFAMQTRSIDGIRKTNGCDEKGQLWAKLDDLVGTIYPSKGGTPVVTLIFPGTHTFHKSAPKLIVKFFKEHAKK